MTAVYFDKHTTNMPAYKKHQHKDFIYQTVQIVYAATKQKIQRIIIITFESSQRFIVHFVINYKHFNLFVLLIFIILMIFVTLAKRKYKTP